MTDRELLKEGDWVTVPREPTEAMVAAYLKANDEYWRKADELPRGPTDPCRMGTPREATVASYRAMIAAAPTADDDARDAARWRFSKHFYYCDARIDGMHQWSARFVSGVRGPSLDEAIDNAMRAQGESK